MAGNGGPWGGGGGNDDRPNGGRAPGDGPDEGERRGGRRKPPEGGGHPISEIDELVRRGQEHLRVLMGGRGGGGPRGPREGGAGGPFLTRRGIALGVLALAAAWVFASVYTVKTEERSVELFLGRSAGVGQPGLNFAPWPVMTYEKVLVTGERTIDIGTAQDTESGLMLTRDQNIVDIGFQIVWNVSDPEEFLFSLENPEGTIRAVAESAMRDIIARSELSPILNRDRGIIASDLRTAVQATLDSYAAGINIIRVNLQGAAPPAPVIDSFREVQAAQQERDRLEKEADGYSNQVTAGARGEAARLVEDAEAYRAQAVNSAEGEAARFTSVLAEYLKAPAVTRRRLYIETMERVYSSMDKVILDGAEAGAGGAPGVVPYLPLDLLDRGQKKGGQ